ncbi:hypothetical protein RI367_002803 [Sorochytrium milnesiophthora]
MPQRGVCGKTKPHAQPALQSSEQELLSTFRKTLTFNTSLDVPITKYVSDNTGLEVVFVDLNMPIVKAAIVVATEQAGEHTNTGIAHALEHLVLAGSHRYPYKDALDAITLRNPANQIDARTSIDYTDYSITTVGQNALVALLPVYMDHVFNPTLTDASFLTEVYHVDRSGAEGGVVYREMHGVGLDYVICEFNRLLHPAPSGYGGISGGTVEHIRNMTNDQIRRYHAAFYRPDNMRIIVQGKANHAIVLQTLSSINSSSASHQPRTPEEELPITESITRYVDLPNRQERAGHVVVGYRGPHRTNHRAAMGIETLLKYLTHRPYGPLYKAFVFGNNMSLCSGVRSNVQQFRNTSHYFHFIDVPVAHLDQIGPNFAQVIQQLVEDDSYFDMKLMESILLSEQKALNAALDHDPFLLTIPIVFDFLYGQAGEGDLARFINLTGHFDQQLAFSKQDWINLAKEHLLDAPSVTAIMRPSKTELARLNQEEQQRPERLRRQFTEQQLQEFGDRLDLAIAENSKQIPRSELSKIPLTKADIRLPIIKCASTIPDSRWYGLSQRKRGLESHKCHSSSTDLQEFLDQRAQGVPYSLVLQELPTRLLYVDVFLDGSTVPKELRQYLPTYWELMGQAIDGYNGAISGELDMDNNQHIIKAKLAVTQAMYISTVEAVGGLLYRTTFDSISAERVQQAVATQVAGLVAQEPDATALKLNALFQTEDASDNFFSATRRLDFLNITQRRLLDAPGSVLQNLQELHEQVTRPDRIRIHIYGAVRNINNVVSPWAAIASSFNVSLHSGTRRLQPIKGKSANVTPLGRQPSSRVTPGQKNHTSLIQGRDGASAGMVDIRGKGVQSVEHEDYPILYMLSVCLSGSGGKLQPALRHRGLAYGVRAHLDVPLGQWRMEINRVAQPFTAYQVLRATVESLVRGDIELGGDMLEKARQVLTFRTANITPLERARGSRWSCLAWHSCKPDYLVDILEKIKTITKEQILHVLQKYLPPMFEPESSIVVVTCSSGQVAQIKQDFASIGYEMDVLGQDSTDSPRILPASEE